MTANLKTLIGDSVLLQVIRDRIEAGEGNSVTFKTDEDGQRSVVLRDIPHSEDTRFTIPGTTKIDGTVLRDVRAKVRAKNAERAEGEGTEGEAAGELEITARTVRGVVVQGIASSTSVDWYGTEMTLEALRSMETQFKNGVPYLPSHRDGWNTPEWDKVIGVSIDAQIDRAQVENAAVDGEAQYVLTVDQQLYGVDKAAELVNRLDGGQPIGQSIGGWFTEIQIIYSATETDYWGDPEIERVLVLNVDLDHNAVTRNPANPDAMGIVVLRDRLSKAVRCTPQGIRMRTDAPQTRTVSDPATSKPAETPDAGEVRDTHAPTVEDTTTANPARNADDDPTTTRTADNAPSPNNNAVTVIGPNDSTDDVDNKDRSRNPDDSRSTESTETGVNEMTPEQIAALVSDVVSRSVTEAVAAAMKPTTDALDDVRSRLSALETRTVDPVAQPGPGTGRIAAPAVRTADDTDTTLPAEIEAQLKQLRDQVARQNDVIARMAAEPVRRGGHAGGSGAEVRNAIIISGRGSGDSYRNLITRARTDGEATALTAIVERSIDVLSEEDGTRFDGPGSSSNLSRLLHVGLRAAETDGLIGTRTAAQWN